MKRWFAVLGMLLLAGCTSPSVQEPDASAVPTPAASQVAGLTVEEYVIDEDPSAFLRMNQEQLRAARARREKWRETAAPNVMARANQVLEPIGCRLVLGADGKVDLYKVDQPLETGIEYINAIYPSADGKDFVLQGAKDAGPLWLTANGPLPREIIQKASVLLRSPVFAGNDLVYLQASERWDIEVVKGGQAVYTYTHPQAQRVTSADYLVQGLTAWEGKWVLETVEGTVIVDGRSLNQQLGYDEIFGFHIQAGKPFFFFKKDGKYRVSSGGQELPQQYDAIAHYGCCDSTALNPRTNEIMTSFHAERDGRRLFVDIGTYH